MNNLHSPCNNITLPLFFQSLAMSKLVIFLDIFNFFLVTTSKTALGKKKE